MVQTLCNWSTMVVEEHQFNIREAAPAQICQRLSTRPCGGERATQFTAISCSDRLMMVDQNQVVYFPKPGIDSWLTWRFLPGNGRIVSLLSLRGWTDIFGSCAEVGQEVRSPDASSVQIHQHHPAACEASSSLDDGLHRSPGLGFDGHRTWSFMTFRSGNPWMPLQRMTFCSFEHVDAWQLVATAMIGPVTEPMYIPRYWTSTAFRAPHCQQSNWGQPGPRSCRLPEMW